MRPRGVSESAASSSKVRVRRYPSNKAFSRPGCRTSEMLEQDALQVCAIPSCGQGPGEILEVLDATNFADVRMRIQCRFDITVTSKDVLCTAHWKSFNRAPRNSKCCDPHFLHQDNRRLRPKATERVSCAISSAAYPAVKIFPGAGVCRCACLNIVALPWVYLCMKLQFFELYAEYLSKLAN